MNTNHKVLAKIGKIVGFVSSFMEIWQICQHTTTFCRYLSLLVHTGSQQEQNTNLGSPRTLLLAFAVLMMAISHQAVDGLLLGLV